VRTVVPLPTVRHGHRIEVIAGGLVCCGGYAPGADDHRTKETWWLGPGESVWRRRADMACGRAFHASTTFGGRVWAIGDGLASYDPAADRWQEWLPKGALPSSHFGAARVGNIVYVLGGEAQTRGRMYCVDLRAPSVAEVDAPPGSQPGDHFPFLVELQGKLHVIGGVDGQVTPLRRHFVRDNETWRALPQPPDWLWAKFACTLVTGDSFYVFSYGKSHRFDVAAGAWHELPALRQAIVLPQAVQQGDLVHILGGFASDGESCRVHHTFDLRRSVWTDLSPR
jgi:hypothetical protein